MEWYDKSVRTYSKFDISQEGSEIIRSYLIWPKTECTGISFQLFENSSHAILVDETTNIFVR